MQDADQSLRRLSPTASSPRSSSTASRTTSSRAGSFTGAWWRWPRPTIRCWDSPSPSRTRRWVDVCAGRRARSGGWFWWPVFDGGACMIRGPRRLDHHDYHATVRAQHAPLQRELRAAHSRRHGMCFATILHAAWTLVRTCSLIFYQSEPHTNNKDALRADPAEAGPDAARHGDRERVPLPPGEKGPYTYAFTYTQEHRAAGLILSISAYVCTSIQRRRTWGRSWGRSCTT